MNDLRAACALLTILPIRGEPVFSARAFSFFPLVGAALGLALAVSFYLARLILPPLVCAAFVVALWALLTGGLHLDGLGDACDALFAAVSRERRLEILRDEHLGAFGATGLVLILLLKFSALTQIHPLAIFFAPLLARWALVYAATFPLARRQGMAVFFTQGLTRREITLATLTVFVCVLPLGWTGVVMWVVAALVATLGARFALGRLGGLTGDVYGMICESVEVSVLMVGAVFIR